MPRADSSLPPIAAIEAALRLTTERLVGELAEPAAEAPEWSDFEWRVAIAVAVLQGISVLLANGLRWRGPELWESFLAEQNHQGVQRDHRIAALLARIDHAASEAGIAAVALKGSALRKFDMYAPGERPMGDVDLLVNSDDFEAIGRLLQGLGYIQAFTTWRHVTFVPAMARSDIGFGEHVDNPIHIELHTRIVERLPSCGTDITSQTMPVKAHAGLNSYPSSAALLRHLLLHAAGNLRARALRFIQLHDIALLSRRLSSSDWDELLASGVGHRGLWWALPPFLLTERYHPAAIPSHVIDSLVQDCPSWLYRVSRKQRVADVSWSQVRIQAFPGVEWSKSPAEALKFMASRVFPDREALASLRRYAATRPDSSSTPWYGLSHPRRILRWVFSHPPRVQTMHSLRQALAYRPSAPLDRGRVASSST